MVKITVMGDVWVTTARVTAPAACTTLPGSTRRSPTRPAMGAVRLQKSDLHLVVLHGALVVLHGAAVLEHQLLLVIQDLLGDGAAFPGGRIAVQVHARLGEHILVPLEHPLGLQELRAVRTRIDVDERIALPHQLAFHIVHGHDRPGHLAGDQGGVDRGDRPDGVEIDAEVTLGGRGAGHGGPGRGVPGGGGLLGVFVVAQEQHEGRQQSERQQAPQDDAHHPGPPAFPEGRQGRAGSDGRLFVQIIDQGASPFPALLSERSGPAGKGTGRDSPGKMTPGAGRPGMQNDDKQTLCPYIKTTNNELILNIFLRMGACNQNESDHLPP